MFIFNSFNKWLIKWLESTNHKDIGSIYFLIGFWSGIIGSAYSIIIRIDLSSIWYCGCNSRASVWPEFYINLVTIHAFLIIFFIVIPIIIGGFGN